MKRGVRALISGMFSVAALACAWAAEPACRALAVEANVEAGGGELTLADLLRPGDCPQLYQAAARVNLGTAPRSGSVRVFDGRQIRRLIEGLEDGKWSAPKDEDEDKAGKGKDESGSQLGQIPARIVVRRAGTMKSCADVGRFVAAAGAGAGLSIADSRWQENLNCAAARSVPEDTALELLKTKWNSALQRWEFALRCLRAEDCVPFLVWARATEPSEASAASYPNMRGTPQAERDSSVALVKAGQTATLIWEQAGIRIVLPVICLEAGGAGQFVRVRFQTAARTLRAEVLGAGRLRAGL